MTVGEALEAGADRLARDGVPDARSEVAWLLSHLLDTRPGALLLRRREALAPEAARRFDDWLERRGRREPAQHIVGVQEFYGLEFKIDGRALIPRPETEGVVDALLAHDIPVGGRVADLGTGSGCIAIALARRRPDLKLHGLDCSPEALALAAENVAALQVGRRVELRQGDMARPPESWHGRMDAVASNPPYVPEADWPRLQVEVREHDPRVALVAGATGLEAYRHASGAAALLLRQQGLLVFELGFGLADRVREIVRGAGFHVVETRPDLNRIPRVLVARKL